jgi:hypothetical protein
MIGPEVHEETHKKDLILGQHLGAHASYFVMTGCGMGSATNPTIAASNETSGESGVRPSMRNLLEESSIAQCLDGQRLKGRLLFPTRVYIGSKVGRQPGSAFTKPAIFAMGWCIENQASIAAKKDVKQIGS